MCLAAWYRSGCTMGLADIKSAVIDPWSESRAQWHAAHPDARQEAEEDAEGAVLIHGMLAGYLDAFASDASDFQVLHVEPQLSRWLTHPKTGKPLRDTVTINGKRKSRQWAYGGAMDLLVRIKDGSVWFMEHKTASEKDLKAYCLKLDWDPQIRGYAWAAAQPNGFDSPIKEPIRITGVIYNVARKKVPLEPETLKNGTLSKSKGTDTTRAHFLSSVLRHGLNPDDYADVLEQLRGKTFFHREHVVFTDPELDDFGRDATASAMEIMQAEKPDAYHPRQQSVCTGIAPRPCPYKELCLTDSKSLRKTFVVRGIRHAELTGILAEDYVAKMRPGYAEPVAPAQPPKVAQQFVDPFVDEAVASSPESLHTTDPFA